jgi:hypothetical protein
LERWLGCGLWLNLREELGLRLGLRRELPLGLWLNLSGKLGLHLGLRLGCARHLGMLVRTVRTRHPGQGSCDEQCEGKTQGFRTRASFGADRVTPESVHVPLDNFKHRCLLTLSVLLSLIPFDRCELPA